MSMRAPSRSQARRQRALVVSLLLVIVVAVASLGGTLAARWSPKLGLDLAGGLSVTYRPAHKVSASDLSETVSVLTNRVDGLGVSGAQVSTQGGDIVVQIPGVKNGRQVLKTIGQTAQLLFRPVLCYAPPYSAATAKSVEKANGGKLPPLPTSCASQYQTTAANLDVNTSTGTPANLAADPTFAAYKSTPSIDDTASKTVLLPGLPGTDTRYLLSPSPLTGHAVKSALAQENATGAWVVNYTLTSSGSGAFDKLADANFHALVAIELDGVVQSAPLIQPTQATFTSFAGQGEISGGSTFTEAYAKNLALAMQFGSLPVRLNPLTTETVSPSLGRSALKAGLGAGIAGLLLVLLYTIVYYRLLGIVVLSGLAVSAALLWSIISALGHTSIAPSFDLAGLTGIIVSIGIIVDSYIVYFERLKDETRSGRTVRTSVDRGFQSAWRTVLAADLVSFAAAAVLFLLAIGEVKGFAFFLGLSTLLDVFMTYFFTRPLVFLLGRNDRLTAGRFGVSRGLAVAAVER